jgi:hypothetical protein
VNAVNVLLGLMLLSVDPQPAIEPATLELYEPVRVATASLAPTALDLPGSAAGTNYLVIVGSLSIKETASDVAVRLRHGSQTRAVAVVKDRSDPDWQRENQSRRRALEMRRNRRLSTAQEHNSAKFAASRSFHLFIKEGNFYDAGNYHEVVAELVAVGRHCLVYVDRDDNPGRFPRALVNEAIEYFDEHVYPRATALLGRHRDVDRNGKFTMLFTHWLGKLSDGKVSLGGFVRGGDFYRDLGPPLSNQCDMMYLNSRIQPGEHLRSLLAHEYVHAITLSEHVFGSGDDESGIDEEAWLNEAISHVAENLFGAGWTNLDYRVSTFLSAPNRYRLVVPDYYRCGLWRCHGSRGSTYLFLRWCVDRYGVQLLRDLVQSHLTGIDNLEAATGTPFDELFRDWSIAVCLDGIDSPTRPQCGLESLDLHDQLGTRWLAGSRPIIAQLGQISVPLAPTSFCPIRVHVPADQIRTLEIVANPETRLQVSLIRLPDDWPLVTMHATTRGGTDDGQRRLVLNVEHQSGAPVRWTHITWERARLPLESATRSSRRATILDAGQTFSEPTSSAGTTLVSQPLPCSASAATLVFKLAGLDAHGRRIAAWCETGQ